MFHFKCAYLFAKTNQLSLSKRKNTSVYIADRCVFVQGVFVALFTIVGFNLIETIDILVVRVHDA